MGDGSFVDEPIYTEAKPSLVDWGYALLPWSLDSRPTPDEPSVAKSAILRAPAPIVWANAKPWSRAAAPWPPRVVRVNPVRIEIDAVDARDTGVELAGAGGRGLYLRRVSDEGPHYHNDQRLLLRCLDKAGAILLETYARVRHADQGGIRLILEDPAAEDLAARISQWLPAPAAGEHSGPTPEVSPRLPGGLRALVCTLISEDIPGVCRRLLDRTRDGLPAAVDSGALELGWTTRRGALHQIETARGEVPGDVARRLARAWQSELARPAVPTKLELVADRDMELWLEARETGRRLERRVDEAWRILQGLLQAITAREDSDPDSLGPTAIAEALVRSLDHHGMEPMLQRHVLGIAASGQTMGLDELFDKWAQALRRAGVKAAPPSDPLPTRAPVRADSPEAAAAGRPATDAGTSGDLVQVRPMELHSTELKLAKTPAEAWSTLRRLSARNTTLPDTDSSASSAATAPADKLLLDAMDTWNATSADRESTLLDHVRVLTGGWSAPLSPRQDAAVELVSQLRDVVDQDPLLSADFKARCRGLMRPLLATELTEEGLGEASSPLRELLSLLEFGSALCEERNDPRTEAVRAAMDAEVATLSAQQRLERVALEAACERLRAQLERQRRAGRASEERVVEACAGQQRLSVARARVSQEIERIFAGSEQPLALIELVPARLAPALIPVLLRDGPDGATWRRELEALASLDAALHRADAKEATDDWQKHVEWLRATCTGTSEEPRIGQWLGEIEQALRGQRVPTGPFLRSREAANDDARPPPALARAVEALATGDWVKMEDPGGQLKLAKLAWRAPDASRFVFVNRLGHKLAEHSGAELATRIGSGRLRVIDQADADLAGRVWRRMLIGQHERLAVRATRDALTELPDRRELERRLGTWIGASERTPLALLWIGVDHLKIINQSHGLAAGDRILKAVGAMLVGELGRHGEAFVARVAGDEFVVCLFGSLHRQATSQAAKLLGATEAIELEINGRRVRISASIGVVSADQSSISIERLLADAERACDAAKEAGRGRYYEFDAGDERLNQMREAANWVGRVEESLRQHRLVLYGQKALALKDEAERDLDYIEVLLRMRTPEGVASPGDFIVAAERYGQIAAIDRFVLQEGTRVLSSLGEGFRARIAFNISARNIIDAAFVEEIIASLSRQPVPLPQICIELTETAAIREIDAAGASMRRLADAGLKLVLDDFGSGWSSYQYLRRLPFDMVKVDGAFIRDIAHAAQDRALARSINEIAHVLGKRTVAEHVEDEATLAQVRAIGFDHAQGFLIDRPRPLVELL
jgi:diguanylate cyclase (GGDEF)-like protein